MTTERRLDERLGLNRVESAEYIGVGVSMFDLMVEDGRMPQPKQIIGKVADSTGRLVWDRTALDLAFKALPDRKAQPKKNPWDRDKPQQAA